MWLGMYLASCMAGVQSRTGELRLRVTDPRGSGISARASVLNAANGYDTHQTSDAEGLLDLTTLPYGLYQVEVTEKGFGTETLLVRIDSNIPEDRDIHLNISVVSTVPTEKAFSIEGQWPSSRTEMIVNE